MHDIWQIVSALGTWAAVIVALFLPIWQNRRRLILLIHSHSYICSKNKVIEYIGVSITNAGLSDIVITSWHFCVENVDPIHMYGNPLTKDVVCCQTFYPQLPHRLLPCDSFSCGMPYEDLIENLKDNLDKGRIKSYDMIVLYVSDSFGKIHIKPLELSVFDIINNDKKE